jgi:hypothetical protein
MSDNDESPTHRQARQWQGIKLLKKVSSTTANPYGRRNALAVIYGVTALLVGLGIAAVGRDISALPLWLGLSLGVYLLGHLLTGGSLGAAEERANEAWESESHKDLVIELPPRIRHMLLQNEEVLVAFHAHPVSLTPWWAGGAFVELLILNLTVSHGHTPVALLVGLVVAAIVAVMTVNWRRSHWYVTNRRVIHVFGLIGTHQRVMPVIRVTDASSDVPFWAKTLATLRITYLPVGYINLESAGQDQAITDLPVIPDANNVARMIQEYATRFETQDGEVTQAYLWVRDGKLTLEELRNINSDWADAVVRLLAKFGDRPAADTATSHRDSTEDADHDKLADDTPTEPIAIVKDKAASFEGPPTPDKDPVVYVAGTKSGPIGTLTAKPKAPATGFQLWLHRTWHAPYNRPVPNTGKMELYCPQCDAVYREEK